MAEHDFPANNSAAKKQRVKPEEPQQKQSGERKKLEPVVSGDVERRKRPWTKRFGDTFVQGDAQSVWSYVVLDVFIPMTKNMIADAVQGGVDRAIFGEARPGGSRMSGRYAQPDRGYVSYGSNSRGPSQRRPEPEPREMSRMARSRHDFDEIAIPTRVEAESVLSMMFELIDRYDQVTLAEFYDLVRVESTFADEKYGWVDLRGTLPQRTRHGDYVLDLPKPIALT